MLESRIVKRFASIHFYESKVDLTLADRRLVYRIIHHFTIADINAVGQECAKIIPRKRFTTHDFVLGDILEWLYLESYIDKINSCYIVEAKKEV